VEARFAPRLITSARKPDPSGASPTSRSGFSIVSLSLVGGATDSVSTSDAAATMLREGSVSEIWRATSATVAVESAITTMSVSGAAGRRSVSLTLIAIPPRAQRASSQCVSRRQRSYPFDLHGTIAETDAVSGADLVRLT